jgi:hypothetical protein
MAVIPTDAASGGARSADFFIQARIAEAIKPPAGYRILRAAKLEELQNG